jgi:hypothetical protein
MTYLLSNAKGSRAVSSSPNVVFIFGGSGNHEQDELLPDVRLITDGIILWFSADTQDFRRVYPLRTRIK